MNLEIGIRGSGRPEVSHVQPTATPLVPPRGQPSVAIDDSFSPAGTSAASLHPDVSAESQVATLNRILTLGREVVQAGRVPVVVIDHHLAGIIPTRATKYG